MNGMSGLLARLFGAVALSFVLLSAGAPEARAAMLGRPILRSHWRRATPTPTPKPPDASDANADASNTNSHAETCDADADATNADAKAESQHDPRRHSDAFEYRKRNHH